MGTEAIEFEDPRPTLSRLALLLVFGLGAGLAAGCGEPEPPPEPQPRQVRYVEVGGEEQQARSRVFSGISGSSQQSRLSFKVGGTLVELPIALGDRLRAGQLVARLDPFQYELEVERAEAELVRARAAERNAQATYERTKELYADNNASRGDLDNTRANAESAAAQVRSAEKLVELSKLQVSYTELRASADCTVASIAAEVNENVGSGSPVAMVNCGDALEVGSSIPESLIGELEEGQSASVTFDSLPDRSFAGTLSEIGQASQQGAAFPITVSIDDPSPELRAGLAAEVRFDFARESRDVALVPLSAVVRGTDGTFVFLAEGGDDGSLATVMERPVEVGDLTADGVQILSGLETGDRVITAGVSVIYEGLEVRLGDPPPTSTAGQG